MEQKISKSAIQATYRQALESGLDDWDARTFVIRHLLPNGLSDSEYYFTVFTIWSLCEK